MSGACCLLPAASYQFQPSAAKALAATAPLQRSLRSTDIEALLHPGCGGQSWRLHSQRCRPACQASNAWAHSAEQKRQQHSSDQKLWQVRVRVCDRRQAAEATARDERQRRPMAAADSRGA